MELEARAERVDLPELWRNSVFEERSADCRMLARPFPESFTGVKDDAWVRLPRETWALGMAYAERSGRKLREIVAKALAEYIARQENK